MSVEDHDKFHGIETLVIHELGCPLLDLWLFPAGENSFEDFPLFQQSFWHTSSATYKGDGMLKRIMRFLTACPVDIQDILLHKNRNDDIILHMAMKENHSWHTIDYLIKLCLPSLHILDATGASCSHLAARYSSDLCVQQLILVHVPELAKIQDNKGFIPLHLCLIHEKAKFEVEVLLKSFPAAVFVPTPHVCDDVPAGTFPLSVAVRKGYAPGTIMMLILAEEDVLMIADADGGLPLHAALRSLAPLATVGMLLGLSMERARASFFIRDQTGMIPMETAVASRCSLEVIDNVYQMTMMAMKTAFGYMMDKECSSHRQMGIKFGDDAPGLMLSAEKCVQDISHVVHRKALVQQNMIEPASVSWCMNEDVARNIIVMHMCMPGCCEKQDDFSTLALLLERFGVNPLVAQDEKGVTLLHIAAARKCPLRVLMLILQMFPKCACVVDVHGNTPMHYAVQNAHARSLVDETICGPWHADVCGAPPMIDKHFSEAEKAARPCLDCVRLVGDAFPDACHIANAAGMMPFDYVVASNCIVDVARLVLSYNQQAIMHKDKYGMTPMHRACTRASPEAIIEKGGFGDGAHEIFLSSGKERFRLISWMLERYPLAAEQKCVDMSMPLHFAAFNNCDVCVFAKVLRACPQALYVGDACGETPLHLAARWINALFASNKGILRILLHEAPHFKELNYNLHSVLRSSLPALMGGSRLTERLSDELTYFISQIERDDNEILVALLVSNPSAIWELDSMGHTPITYTCHLVAQCIGTPNFAGVFQFNLVFTVCVLGVLRTNFVPYERALFEMDRICDLQRDLKDRIAQSDMSTSGVEVVCLDAAFKQMADGLMSVREALELSAEKKRVLDKEARNREELCAIQSELAQNMRILHAQLHEKQLLEMLEEENKAPVAAAGGARRKQRNKRIAEDKREKASAIAEQEHIMQTIQGQLMRQSTDNARIKTLNRKKRNKGMKNRPPVPAVPDTEAGAAGPPSVHDDMYDSCGSGTTEVYEPNACDAVEGLFLAVEGLFLDEPSVCDAVEGLFLDEPSVCDAVQGLFLDEPNAAVAPAVAPAGQDNAPLADDDGVAAFRATERAACVEEARASILAQQNRERECAVCMDAVATNPFVPCGHVAVCDACAGQRGGVQAFVLIIAI